MIIHDIKECIGNTPLYLVPESIHGIPGLSVYAKCEFLNPFGSVKDRTAMGLLEEVGDEEWIIESSSGNTGKALGVLASVAGKKLLDVSRKMHQQEVEDLIRIVGADIHILPPGSECPDPTDPHSPFEVIRSYMKESPGKYYYTDQFANPNNPRIHAETTAPEIEKDIGTPDFFFAGLGTTGSSKGIRDYFAHRGNMQTIGITTAGYDHLPGIRNAQEMFEVGLFRPDLYNDTVEVDEQSAIDDMLILIRKCGLLVGPTSGATFHGMKEYFKKQDPKSLHGKTAVFIACDRLEPYTGYLRSKRRSLFESQESLTLEAPGETQSKREEVHSVEPGSNDFIIDMRSYISYEMSHIRGSVCFPFAELRKYLTHNYLPFPRETRLIFVCPFGEESAILADMAHALGYDATSLSGGYIEYQKKYPDHIIYGA